MYQYIILETVYSSKTFLFFLVISIVQTSTLLFETTLASVFSFFCQADDDQGKLPYGLFLFYSSC